MFISRYQPVWEPTIAVHPILRAALSKEEGSRDSDFARDEENFRSGLKRNIAQLSNLLRVNKEELARLRKQVQCSLLCLFVTLLNREAAAAVRFLYCCTYVLPPQALGLCSTPESIASKKITTKGGGLPPALQTI